MDNLGARGQGQGSRVRKILIVRLDRLGDVVLSTPVIKAVRQAFPESYIAFMARPYTREVLEGNPYLNEVIVYDKKLAQKNLSGNLKFIKELKGKKFDLAIILHPTRRTHIITFLAGIPGRIGYDKKWGCLLTKRIPHTKQLGLKHEIDYSLDLVRGLGIDAQERGLFVPVRDSSEKKIEKIFAENGLGARDLIISLNPGASCASKRWDAGRFAQACERLMKKFNAKVVLISDSGDKVLADKVAALLKARCVNLSGRTDVADIASVLKRSKLFISNDSGPVHIACAVGTPVIAIFGRSDRGLSPLRWGPSGKSDIVLHKYVGCKICLAHNCKSGFKCLQAVTVDDVVNAATKILGA